MLQCWSNQGCFDNQQNLLIQHIAKIKGSEAKHCSKGTDRTRRGGSGRRVNFPLWESLVKVRNRENQALIWASLYLNPLYSTSTSVFHWAAGHSWTPTRLIGNTVCGLHQHKNRTSGRLQITEVWNCLGVMVDSLFFWDACASFCRTFIDTRMVTVLTCWCLADVMCLHATCKHDMIIWFDYII